jgi:Flp pilus assembly pilin Flp
MRRFLKKLYRQSHAQDMVEYALLAGFLALTIGGTFPMAGRPMIKIVNKVVALLVLAGGGAQQVSC